MVEDLNHPGGDGELKKVEEAAVEAETKDSIVDYDEVEDHELSLVADGDVVPEEDGVAEKAGCEEREGSLEEEKEHLL